MQDDVERICDFWFGRIEDGFPVEDRQALWYQGGREVDLAIEQRFGALVASALEDQLDHWQSEPRGRLALIVLLDQFTRNIHRGSAAAFSGDGKALTVCKEGLELGHDERLALVERCFFYLPLEHSESLADQRLCVQLFEKLLDLVPAAKKERIRSNRDYAIAHREIIEQFGRFPHRNQILGRVSTAAELDYLSGDHDSFGQAR